MDDHSRLLQVFDIDPDEASDKLRAVMARLVNYFRWRRCPDPEDLAQETLCRGFGRILEGVRIDPPPIRFFYGIAKNVVFETRKAAARGVTVNLDDVLLSLLPIDFRTPDSSILLEEYLCEIPADEAELLIRYHTEDRVQLAADLGTTDKALRVRVFRAKSSLEAQLKVHASAGR